MLLSSLLNLRRLKIMVECCPNLAHHKRWVWVLSVATAGLFCVVFREHLVSQLSDNDTVFKDSDGIRTNLSHNKSTLRFRQSHTHNRDVHPIESLHHHGVNAGANSASFTITDDSDDDVEEESKQHNHVVVKDDAQHSQDTSQPQTKESQSSKATTIPSTHNNMEIQEDNHDSSSTADDPKKTKNDNDSTTTKSSKASSENLTKKDSSSDTKKQQNTDSKLKTDISSDNNDVDSAKATSSKSKRKDETHSKPSQNLITDPPAKDNGDKKKQIPTSSMDNDASTKKQSGTTIESSNDKNDSSLDNQKVKNDKKEEKNRKSAHSAKSKGQNEEKGADSPPKVVVDTKKKPRVVSLDPHVVDPASLQNLEGTSTTFVEQNCQLQGADWYPTGSDAWQQRAPYFLIAGAYKSGTSSMASYLSQHPQVIQPLRGSNLPSRTTELQFFLYKNFRRFVSTQVVALLNNEQTPPKTFVKSARTVMLARHYHKKTLAQDTSMVSFDSTPGYLLYSSILPQRILCVAPWVKVLVVLRNPVDRVYSNYLYNVRLGGLQDVSFEDWLEKDFENLRQAGVIQEKPSIQDFSGSPAETAAWTQYLLKSDEHAIGRSMYVIQLRHWFKAFQDIGRDPQTEFHIVRSEDLLDDVDTEYTKVLEFLGLPDTELKSKTKKVVGDHTQPMNKETRKKLEDFFAPYNQQLYKLMGGGDWDGFWEK